MRSKTKELASKNLNIRPTEIWKNITDEMNKKSNTWKGMSDCQVKKLVKQSGVKISGYDVFSELEKQTIINGSNFLAFLLAV